MTLRQLAQVLQIKSDFYQCQREWRYNATSKAIECRYEIFGCNVIIDFTSEYKNDLERTDIRTILPST